MGFDDWREVCPMFSLILFVWFYVSSHRLPLLRKGGIDLGLGKSLDSTS